MSLGIFHNEGRLVMCQLVAGIPAPDRGIDLELCLFTACTNRNQASIAADFTEPTQGAGANGYARIQLPPSALVATGTMMSTNAAQTFAALAGGFGGGAVLGYFVLTTGTTPRVLASELFDSGPYTMVAGARLNILWQFDLNL